MNMPRSQRPTVAEATHLPPVAARRFYVVQDGSDIHVVATGLSHLFSILATLDMEADTVMITEVMDDVASKIKIRPCDDSPADNLADAPLGAVYSSEE